MKRFALLIEASEVPNQTKLPGAVADIQGFSTWLKTQSGGLWRKEEIVDLHTPTVASVKSAIRLAGSVDYAFVAFSGHGFHAKELDLTKACLRDGDMSIRDLFPTADRGSIVVDACRNVMPEIFEETIQMSLVRESRFAKASVARDYRKDFDVAVANAEKGYTFLYSCDLNESAGESPRGGYFSRYMLEAGLAFAEKHIDGTSWLSMSNAFDRASQSTTARNKLQHPQFDPGRRLKHFPFAV